MHRPAKELECIISAPCSLNRGGIAEAHNICQDFKRPCGNDICFRGSFRARVGGSDFPPGSRIAVFDTAQVLESRSGFVILGLSGAVDVRAAPETEGFGGRRLPTSFRTRSTEPPELQGCAPSAMRHRRDSSNGLDPGHFQESRDPI